MGDQLAIEGDAAFTQRHQAHQGFEQGGFSHAIASEQNSDLSSMGLQTDIAQNMRAAIVLMDVLYIQHGLASQIHINHTFIGLHLFKAALGQYRAVAKHGHNV